MKLTRAGLFLKPDLANISLEHTRPVSPSLRMKWILCFTNPWPKGPGLYSKGVIGQVLEICFGLSSLLGQYVLNKLKTLSWNGFYNHPCVPCVLGVEKDRSTRPRWWFQIFFIFIPISGRFPLGLIFSNGLKPPTRDTFSLMQKNIGKKLRQKFPRYRKFIQKAASDHTETTGKKISEKKKWFWQRRPCGDFITLRFFSDVFPKLWLLLAVFVKVRRAEGWPGEASTKNTAAIYLVVSNIFYFHPYLGKWSNLPNIFRRGWNHQLVIHESLPGLHQEDSRVQIAAVRYKVRRIRSRSRGPDPMDFTQNGH